MAAEIDRHLLPVHIDLVTRVLQNHIDAECVVVAGGGACGDIEIRETILSERMPLFRMPLAFFLPRIVSRNYRLTIYHREEFCFDANAVGKIKRVGRLLKDVSLRHEIPWEVVKRSDSLLRGW